MNSILRALALALMSLFVVTFPISLLLHDMGELAFDPETTKSLVRDYLLRSEFVASLARRATEQMVSGEPLLGEPESAEASVDTTLLQRTIGGLTEADWREITDLTVPNRLVEQSLTEVIDAYTLWLNGQDDFPPLQVNLLPWKENLREKSGDVIAIVLDSLPECTLEQAIAMSLEGLQSSESLAGIIPICRPPEPVYSALLANGEFLLAGTLTLTPDTIDLDWNDQNLQPPRELVELREALLRARFVLNWGWLAVVALGIAAVAISARTLEAVLVWSGWPLLLAGAGTLFLGLAFRFFNLAFVDDAIGSLLGGSLGIAGSAGTAIVGAALDFVSRPLLLQGFFITITGLASIFTARYLAQNNPATGIPINRRRIGL
jgi:hypothetical protein